jgi:hypothetical protein
VSQNDVSNFKHLLRKSVRYKNIRLAVLITATQQFIFTVLMNVECAHHSLLCTRRNDSQFPAKQSALSGAQFLRQPFECDPLGR